MQHIINDRYTSTDDHHVYAVCYIYNRCNGPHGVIPMHKAAQSLEAYHRAMPYKVTNRHVSLAEGRRVLLRAATPAYAPTMQHIESHHISPIPTKATE